MTDLDRLAQGVDVTHLIIVAFALFGWPVHYLSRKYRLLKITQAIVQLSVIAVTVLLNDCPLTNLSYVLRRVHHPGLEKKALIQTTLRELTGIYFSNDTLFMALVVLVLIQMCAICVIDGSKARRRR